MNLRYETQEVILEMNDGTAQDIVLVLEKLPELIDKAAVLEKLDQIIENQEKSLMNEAAMAEALTALEEVTNEQGTQLTTIGTAQDNLAADIEAFINKPVPASGPSAEQVAQAQSIVARARAIRDAIAAQAVFSTALAGKTEGGEVVIPTVPVPDIPPAEPPV